MVMNMNLSEYMRTKEIINFLFGCTNSSVKAQNELKNMDFVAIKKLDDNLEDLGQAEILSSTIGKYVMEGLKELDPVAYVRFASVYTNFKEAKDFEQFVDQLNVPSKK